MIAQFRISSIAMCNKAKCLFSAVRLDCEKSMSSIYSRHLYTLLFAAVVDVRQPSLAVPPFSSCPVWINTMNIREWMMANTQTMTCAREFIKLLISFGPKRWILIYYEPSSSPRLRLQLSPELLDRSAEKSLRGLGLPFAVAFHSASFPLRSDHGRDAPMLRESSSYKNPDARWYPPNDAWYRPPPPLPLLPPPLDVRPRPRSTVPRIIPRPPNVLLMPPKTLLLELFDDKPRLFRSFDKPPLGVSPRGSCFMQKHPPTTTQQSR